MPSLEALKAARERHRCGNAGRTLAVRGRRVEASGIARTSWACHLDGAGDDGMLKHAHDRRLRFRPRRADGASRACRRAFPHIAFVYLGDHANVPYGNRPSDEIVDSDARTASRRCSERGCKLVLLGCNTATVRCCPPPAEGLAAGERLARAQHPRHRRADRRGGDADAVGRDQRRSTRRSTIPTSSPCSARRARSPRTPTPKRSASAAPRSRSCSRPARSSPAPSSDDAPEAELDRSGRGRAIAAAGADRRHATASGDPRLHALPLVEHLFRRHLPPFTRILSQPEVVADSLEDYLARRPHYLAGDRGHSLTLLTTGNPALISGRARVFWPEVAAFELAAA